MLKVMRPANKNGIVATFELQIPSRQAIVY